ncbi:MAG: DUF429 domain-containing protein [Candidatus Aenigmatarchaeota archaeon]
MRVVGIDLAGKEKNPTGFCLLIVSNQEESTETMLLYTDDEIIRESQKAAPDLICIDAPLSFPEHGYFRDSDIELKRRGFKPLSPLFPSMALLTKRGIKLKIRLEKMGYKIIEVFPMATEKILGLEKEKKANKDKYDSLLCALTGKYYLKNSYELIGNEIVLPRVD